MFFVKYLRKNSKTNNLLYLVNSNFKPPDQEGRDLLEIDRKNYGAKSLDHHLHSATGSKACCSLSGRNWNEMDTQLSKKETPRNAKGDT